MFRWRGGYFRKSISNKKYTEITYRQIEGHFASLYIGYNNFTRQYPICNSFFFYFIRIILCQNEHYIFWILLENCIKKMKHFLDHIPSSDRTGISNNLCFSWNIKLIF